MATGGFTRPLRPKQASAWLGICPLDHESGSSVKRKRKRSRGYGPSAIRKLLYLASMRLVSIDGSPHQAYFERKKAEGKSGRLVLNNRTSSSEWPRPCSATAEPYEAGHVSARPTI